MLFNAYVTINLFNITSNKQERRHQADLYIIMQSTKSDTGTKKSRYFFSIRLNRLESAKDLNDPIKISLYKGVQKLDQSKQLVHVQAGQKDMSDLGVSLEFHMATNNNTKGCQYRVVFETVDSVSVGEIKINTFGLLEDLEKKGETTFTIQQRLNDDVQIQLVVFVEKSRQNLTESVRSYSQTNSVAKFRTQPNKSTNKTGDLSGDSSKHRDSKTRQNESFKAISADLSQDIDTNENEQLPTREQRLLMEEIIGQRSMYRYQQQDHDDGDAEGKNKVYDQLDQFQSISMINSNQQGTFSTKLALFGSMLFLGLLCYFIITIEDQKLELSRIKNMVVRTISSRDYRGL